MFTTPINTFKTGVRYISALLLLPLIFSSISVAEVAGEPEADVDPQESWYQIEIIVFSNLRESSSGELWPDLALQYPAEMLIIGPNLDSQLSPRNLAQLKILENYQQLSETPAEIIGVETNNSEFLFDDPRLVSPGRSTPSLSDDLQEADFLAGLVREQTPEVYPRVPDASVEYTEQDPVETGIDPEGLEFLEPGPDLLFQQDPAHQAYRNLPRQEFSLNALAKRIGSSRYYHLLYHAAWRQPIQAMEKAMPILLHAGKQYDDYSELDGFITISRARYLHIDTDLWFTTFSPRSGQASMVMPDNTLNYPEGDRELLQRYPDINLFETRRNNYLPVQTYRMVQSRRMRSSTLHYLDHPAFSLLIRVEKFSLPESDSAASQPDLQQLPQLR
jgi:hypothetical protein